MREGLKKPLTGLIRTIQDGRILRLIFLAMLALSVGTIGQDYATMVASVPDGLPGSHRLEPAPMQLPLPGDQTRPYLPKTMPLGPSRGKPDLPGYHGPLDGSAISEPMQFALGPQGRASAIGTIDPGAAQRLAEFLKENDREIAELTLHSPGGSVGDALSMALQIRSAGISTRVANNGYCASSCPLVLASGLYRSAGKNSFVGVHQVYALPTATGTVHTGMANAQAISAACQQLLIDMGVDLNVWVKAMSTPPDSLYLFTPDELTRYRLANLPQELPDHCQTPVNRRFNKALARISRSLSAPGIPKLGTYRENWSILFVNFFPKG